MGDATERLAPSIKDIPGTNHFALDTSTIGSFKEQFFASGLFATEFGVAVDRYYSEQRRRIEALTPADFDQIARDGRGPWMTVEDMDIFFCAQEYEYSPQFVESLEIFEQTIDGERATLVVESSYGWKTTFHLKRVSDKWLISGYCVYK